LVEQDQFSLAIGKGGQNVRLAAKLTGYRIDIRSRGGDQMVEAPTPETESPETVA
jgi:N utilization substance protein A